MGIVKQTERVRNRRNLAKLVVVHLLAPACRIIPLILHWQIKKKTISPRNKKSLKLWVITENVNKTIRNSLLRSGSIDVIFLWIPIFSTFSCFLSSVYTMFLVIYLFLEFLFTFISYSGFPTSCSNFPFIIEH